MKELKLREGEYLPDVGIDYPEDDPFARIVPAPKIRDLKFDESYPFIEDTFSFKAQRALAYFIVLVLMRILNHIRFGIRFEGRKTLWKYRRQFRKGIISVSNHCYPWDGAAVSQAFNHRLWVPMLSDHFNGPQYWYLKYFGGIPLPDGSYGALKKFNEAFDIHHERGGWIHVFPEARNWNFYKPVKPFRKGAFTMAYKYACPLVPVGISYRERKGIYKLFMKPEIPLLTVRIGEPIFPDTSKPRRQEVERLLHESRKAIIEMNGIVENPWPDTWNED